MEFDKKKFIALGGLILVIFLIGYLAYRAFFAAPAAAPTTEEQVTITESQANQLITSTERDLSVGETAGDAAGSQFVFESAAQITPGESGSKIVAVTTLVTDPTDALAIAGDGETFQYYNKLDGKFYRADADGNKVALSEDSFPAVQDIKWAPNKDIAALKFPDGNKAIYDFDAKKQYSIPGHWDNLDFSPDSKQIAGKSLSPDPKLRYLFTSNIDGTGAKAVEPLGDNANKVIVSWSPNNQVIAFSRTAPAVGGSADRQGVLLIGKNGENFRQMTVEGLGFQPTWSPTGDRIMYNAHNGASDLMPTLWIDGGTSDTVGVAKNYLDVNTWASKCTFLDDDEAICAVPDPDRMIPGIGFAPQLATHTNDTMYKINIRTGLQTLVGKPDGEHTIETVSVSKDGEFLFMKDQNSGEILKIRLK